jgi:phosphoribosylformylglycinamidine synthase
MKCGVVVFPGSNCDHDVYHVLKHVLAQEVQFLWHQDTDLRGCELVVLPGGFAYGDYLRAGAVASLSPVMAAIKRHAAAGGLVLGICNGFQILLESGLLAGAMRRNRDLRFQCEEVYLSVERNDLPFTCHYSQGQMLRMPIAHAEGNYTDSAAAIERLESRGQVVLRYVDANGNRDEHCVNGSMSGIAGLCNESGNVMAMMPHPERCAEEVLGSSDGLGIFSGAIEFIAMPSRAAS